MMRVPTGYAGTRGYGLLERYLAERRFRQAEALLGPLSANSRLLDVGCGIYPAFLLRQECEVRCGIDREIADELQSHPFGQVQLLQCDFEKDIKLPFEEAAFDVATMLAVVEHLEAGALPALMAEVRRVLRPGGRLVLTTPSGWCHALLRGLATIHVVSPVEIAEHKSVYARSRLRELLAEAGFDPAATKVGYFECLANSWVLATAAQHGRSQTVAADGLPPETAAGSSGR